MYFIGNEIVITRAISNTFPVDINKYFDGFGWKNGYMLGFDKMKKLTDANEYNLVVEIYSKNTNATAEYLGFKVTDSLQGQISYDAFHLLHGQMTNAIRRSGTFQSCGGIGFWWGNCDWKNIFHPNLIIWSTLHLNYIKISLKRQDVWLLSEGKPSRSISTYGQMSSDLVFDGNFDDFFATDPEVNPWLIVDLEDIFWIHYIVIYYRITGNVNGAFEYVHRITEAKIQVHDNSFMDNNFQVCATFVTAIKSIETFHCQGYTRGQYVRLIILDNGPARYLNLNEMQCFGTK